MMNKLSIKAGLTSPLLPLWLLPALLPLGRSAELCTALCLIGSIMLLVREPRALGEHAGAKLFLALMAAYIGAALFSAVDAVAPGKAWGTVAAVLRYLPIGIYACFAMRRPSRLFTLYRATAVVIVVWVLDAWVQAATGWSLGGHAEAERVSGIFGADNLKLGPTLAVLSPFLLWAARERWGWRGLLSAALAMLGPILLAGSRAAWLCYGVVVLAFAWVECGGWRRFLPACLAIAVAAGAGAGVAWEVSAPFHARMERTLEAFRGHDANVDEALTGRLSIWRASLHMAAAHPVNGVGVRSFRYAYPSYAPANDHFVTDESCGAGEGACHAHQLLLEILTETGALGLVLWFAATCVAIRHWWTCAPAARTRAFPVTVALSAMLFPINTHLAFYSAWWGLLFAWLLALWCAALYADIPDTDEKAAP